MVKRTRGGRTPQARHGNKSTRSRHDKRRRLERTKIDRLRTHAAAVPLSGCFAALVHAMSWMLDSRIAFRLPITIAGAMLARGRRTASSWFRCGGVGEDWDRFYDLLITIGRNVHSLILPLAIFIVRKFDPGEGGFWTLAIDDSPTKRYGRHVEGANIHHNPTPGPGDGPWIYGHSWVSLAVVLKHRFFGSLALPLLSELYVRAVDVKSLDRKYRWQFRTKHQIALDAALYLIEVLRAAGSSARMLFVADGAYFARDLIVPLVDAGATFVCRLRRDAKLFGLPVNRAGQRGRRRKYGKNTLSLASRASRREGWEPISYNARGVMNTVRCKSFLATSRVVGGVIRVVIVEYRRGQWAAYMSTDAQMTAEQIMTAVADRWSIEEAFHDVKEVWGAGEQQVRNIWSNIGCWNLCTWLLTLTDLSSWDDTADQLVDRSDRPWDNALRRPSRADRRRRIAREMLEKDILTGLPPMAELAKMRQSIERLIALAA